MKCKATSKRSGELCRKDAVVGKDVCHIHGGKSKSGVSSGTFATGKYSKDLVGNLQQSYLEELEDGELVELRHEIAVARSYIRQIMQEGESGVRWRDVASAARELRQALREKDTSALMAAADDINRIAARGERDWAHRHEVMQRMESVRRLADSEHKHRIDNRLAVSHEQLAATIGAVVNVVTQRVKDRAVIDAIDADIKQLISRSGPVQPGAPESLERN